MVYFKKYFTFAKAQEQIIKAVIKKIQNQIALNAILINIEFYNLV